MLLMLIWDFYLFAGKCEPRDRRAGDPINPNRIVARVSKSFPNGQQKCWREINLGAGSGFTFSALIATSLILMRARFKFRKEILVALALPALLPGFQTCRRHCTYQKCGKEFGNGGNPRSRTFKRLNPLPRHIIVDGMSIITIVVAAAWLLLLRPAYLF